MSDRTIPVTILTESELNGFLDRQTESAARWIEANGFKAQPGSHLLMPDGEGGIERILCGVGEARTLYAIAHLATLQLDAELRLEDDWSAPETRLMALGYRLAAYRFDRYKSAPGAPELALPEDDEHEALVTACYRVRDWVNTPTEDMGPEQLADMAAEVGALHGAQVETIVGDALLKQNYPAIHTVGRAAAREPRLIDLSWGDEDHPRLVLVGKGVCFDSGGLNIKGASGMRLMKKDMGGAAHALALAGLIMERELPVQLRLFIPAVENAISGNAYRPGDVVQTRAGKTVEIGNTDAEGRVVLCDALARGSELAPDLMIDFATLTGAARIALGPDLPPIYSNDDELAQACIEASRTVEDPLWHMPLFEGYEEMIDTPIADVSNSGSSPMAGSITAGLFLQRFVDENIPWAHLDVYAWSPNDRPGRPQGGEAQGLRAIFEMLKNRYG